MIDDNIDWTGETAYSTYIYRWRKWTMTKVTSWSQFTWCWYYWTMLGGREKEGEGGWISNWDLRMLKSATHHYFRSWSNSAWGWRRYFMYQVSDPCELSVFYSYGKKNRISSVYDFFYWSMITKFDGKLIVHCSASPPIPVTPTQSTPISRLSTQ